MNHYQQNFNPYYYSSHANRQQQLSSHAISWPEWDKIRIDVQVDGSQVCITISYGGNRIGNPLCYSLPQGCVYLGEVDIGSAAGAKLYFRYLEVCTTYIKGQVWAKAGPLKTKLGEFHIEFFH